MEHAHRSTRLLVLGWLLGLGILLASCAPDSTPAEPALDEEVEAGADEEGDDEPDTGKAADATHELRVSVIQIQTPHRPLRAYKLAAISKAALNALREVIRNVRSDEILRFAIRDTKGGQVGFDIPATAFLGGAPDWPLLAPTEFHYKVDWRSEQQATYIVNHTTFQEALSSLSSVTFASVPQAMEQLLARVLANDNPGRGLTRPSDAYPLLARLYYTLVVGPCSDAAQTTMANPATKLGDLALTFATRYADLRAYAWRKNLLRVGVPLIFTASTVLKMATSFDLPPGSFLDVVVFLCGY